MKTEEFRFRRRIITYLTPMLHQAEVICSSRIYQTVRFKTPWSATRKNEFDEMEKANVFLEMDIVPDSRPQDVVFCYLLGVGYTSLN